MGETAKHRDRPGSGTPPIATPPASFGEPRQPDQHAREEKARLLQDECRAAEGRHKMQRRHMPGPDDQHLEPRKGERCANPELRMPENAGPRERDDRQRCGNQHQRKVQRHMRGEGHRSESGQWAGPERHEQNEDSRRRPCSPQDKKADGEKPQIMPPIGAQPGHNPPQKTETELATIAIMVTTATKRPPNAIQWTRPSPASTTPLGGVSAAARDLCMFRSERPIPTSPSARAPILIHMIAAPAHASPPGPGMPPEPTISSAPPIQASPASELIATSWTLHATGTSRNEKTSSQSPTRCRPGAGCPIPAGGCAC